MHGRGNQARHLGHVAGHDEGGGGILSHLAIGLHGFFGHLELYSLFAAGLANGRGNAFDGFGVGFGDGIELPMHMHHLMMAAP